MSFEFNKALNMTKENDRDINSNRDINNNTLS